jgi:hypothetical protein
VAAAAPLLVDTGRLLMQPLHTPRSGAAPPQYLIRWAGRGLICWAGRGTSSALGSAEIASATLRSRGLNLVFADLWMTRTHLNDLTPR